MSEGAFYALAVLSTLAGNLLMVGTLANIIALERAREAGVALPSRSTPAAASR